MTLGESKHTWLSGVGRRQCIVCEGKSASCPAYCPGRAMTQDEKDGVGQGKLNFFGGKWHTLGPVYWLPIPSRVSATWELFDHDCHVASVALVCSAISEGLLGPIPPTWDVCLYGQRGWTTRTMSGTLEEVKEAVEAKLLPDLVRLALGWETA